MLHNSMKKSVVIVLHILMFAILLSLFASGAYASCSCVPGSRGSFIGLEITADECPAVNADDNSSYHYVIKAISCSGEVSLFAHWGDTYSSPGWLGKFMAERDLKMFRNDLGTHFIAVSSNFDGKINGLRMSDYPKGQVYNEKSMHQLCVSDVPELIDEDQDGIPRCLDCNDKDNEIGSGLEDEDQDGVPKCIDCDDTNNNIGAGKGIDLDGDGVDQCQDCNDNDKYQTDRCFQCTTVGYPVDFVTGTMTHDLDLISLPAAPVPLRFRLKYNSHEDYEKALGVGWTHNLDVKLDIAEDVIFISDNSKKVPTFITHDQGEHYYPSGTTKGSLIKTEVGYVYTKPNAELMKFDLDGRLLEEVDLHGLTTSYEYNSSGQLVLVKDPSERKLVLDYYPNGTKNEGLLMSVVDPADNMFIFSYYANRLLSKVTYPDIDEDPTNNPVLQLQYADFPDEGLSNGGDPTNLTKLIDTLGNAYSWSYDVNDRATLTTGPQDSNRFELTYENLDKTVVLNSKSNPTTYTYDDDTNTITAENSSCTSCSQSTIKRYDNAWNLLEKVDGEGSVTRYIDYDSNGNAGTVIEAAGTGNELIRKYTYHPKFNKITSVKEQSVDGKEDSETNYTYDENTGDLLSVTKKGYSDGKLLTLKTSYSYNSRGQIVKIDGPRTDVQDITTIAYDSITGYVVSVTKPLVGTTQYQDYNALGYSETRIDTNGNVIKYTYDYSGRPLQIEGVDGGVTTYSYNSEGRLVSTTMPMGNTLLYSYDYANRLVSTTDTLGNSIRYSYDSEGNRTKEEILDNEGVVTKTVDYEYDEKNRLWKVIYPDGTYLEYHYDNNNNTSRYKDTDNNVTEYIYDNLNRLIQVKYPTDGLVDYAYDKNQNVTSIKDQNGNITTYKYDDFGRVLSKYSPDTGSSIFTYDMAGNLVKKTDAKGLNTTYAYDALNRLISVHYADSMQDVYYTYDEGINGKGMLTGMQDPSGTTRYFYNRRGDIVKEIKKIVGVRYVVQYTYDLNGNLISTTYPDGNTVNYIYDNASYLREATTVLNNEQITLAKNITYAPFGGVESMQLFNGIVRTTSYDNMYRLSAIKDGSILDRRYTYNNSNDVENIVDGLNSARNQTFNYDELSRLISASGEYGTISYSYDSVGNRTTVSQGSQIDSYTYNQDNNQLIGVSGALNRNYSYDDTGNIVQSDNTNLVYDQRNQLIKIVENYSLTGEYVYNGNGQRIIKKTQNGMLVYHYNILGDIISVTDGHGIMKEKYFYSNGERIAKFDISYEPLDVGNVDEDGNVDISDAEQIEKYLVGLATLTPSQLIQADVTLDGKVDAKDAMFIKQIANGLRTLPPGEALENVYFYHNDHLGTPVALTDQVGKQVWSSQHLPFGQVYQQDGIVEQPFRFPGQYFDEETGLHYNWHRFYDPETGRYISADPIGLAGGMNLYAYVGGNPVNWIDPDGRYRLLVELEILVYRYGPPVTKACQKAWDNFGPGVPTDWYGGVYAYYGVQIDAAIQWCVDECGHTVMYYTEEAIGATITGIKDAGVYIYNELKTERPEYKPKPIPQITNPRPSAQILQQ